MARLRRSLGDDAKKPRYVITRQGIGYTMPSA
jgi:DNA-binding response OmpR family regulator